MITLSKHFIENWRARVGNEPSPELVQGIMQYGVIVLKPRVLMTPEGKPFKQLGIYWDPELQVIVKIDEFKGRAVSVLAPKNGRGK
ncbi:MAG: hypothetical protein JRJ66_01575 [Deltaproteobacteria bacterium]|nr:hypothetical protein [Deltaproteobacteria bacterium]MBW2081665.1 hypothetical protein [Deltaproteobacteria bacterium]MBW2298860.1 hypothetical protein [Deltaproteobacteria bacterium]